MRRLLVILLLPLMAMPFGCITATGGPPATTSKERRVDATDISRIKVFIAYSMAPELTLEAFVSPSGMAMLVATERWVGAVDSEPRIARDTLSAEEWASLTEIARAEEVLAWRPYSVPPAERTDLGGIQFTVGGEGWALLASASDLGFPGGVGFLRIAERLSTLALNHRLEDELDFVTGFATGIPPTGVDSTMQPTAPSDLIYIAAGALPPGQDPSDFYPLGDFVFVNAERDVSIHQRPGLDRVVRRIARQDISAADWDALVDVIEAEQLMTWLPPKPKHHSGEASSESLPVDYWFSLMGPEWVRTVVVPAADAGVLGELLRRMARLAEDRTSEAFPYFDRPVGSGEGAP